MYKVLLIAMSSLTKIVIKITFEGQRLQFRSIATLSPFVYALPSSKDMQVKGLEELERKLLS